MTTTADMIAALHRRYPQSKGQWAGIVEFCGIDYLSVACWQSLGFAVHGHEIKVSRADWLRELKDPYKSAVNIPFCDHWWLVAPKGIAKEEEIPEGWGFLEWNGFNFWVVRTAPALREPYQRGQWKTGTGKIFDPNENHYSRRGFAMMARRYAYAQADRDALMGGVERPQEYLDVAAQQTGRTTFDVKRQANDFKRRLTQQRKQLRQLRGEDDV